jgi:hypothetical protein
MTEGETLGTRLARKLEEIFTMVGHFENTISY